ncbi:sugar nucleotidyltransferase [Shimia ponticola]|uniref:sugar nucleotidyltransferase n=1 Tax=Shimia ponticola TaxID=2582893 RepID=UPI0011BE7E67|nr:sugar phosphate nucleotidyltransferase [Shimia ponticola]
MRGYKGIILAGGTGSRLWPTTRVTSKQLMPVYDKPMIYYPLTTLMEAGLRDIAIITTPQDHSDYRDLLGDGAQWGIDLTYIAQPRPDGLAQAYLLADAYLDGAPSVLILGDNLFDVPQLPSVLRNAMARGAGATILGASVPDPERFGLAHVDTSGHVVLLEEKPQNPTTNTAVTGVYVCDARATIWAKTLTPSARGELEIIDLLNLYLSAGALRLLKLPTDNAACWMDTGTHDGLFSAAQHVRSRQQATGDLIGSPDLTAYRQGWIEAQMLFDLADQMKTSGYGQALHQNLKRGQGGKAVERPLQDSPARAA